MTYSLDVRRAKNSRRWTEELPVTYRILLQTLIWEYLNKCRPTIWHLHYYVKLLHSIFQILIHPTSGACDYWLRSCVGCNDRGLLVNLVVRVIPILCVVCGSEWVFFCKGVVSCISWKFCVWYVWCDLVGLPLFKYQFDARSNTHKINLSIYYDLLLYYKNIPRNSINLTSNL